MEWTMLEDTSRTMMRWQARLTGEDPVATPLSMALVSMATLHAEGNFGSGELEVSGSNSGDTFVPFDVIRFPDVVAVLPVMWLRVRALNPDETTDLRVTVAGHR